MVMAPNGTLITPETAKKMKDSGIKRISVSLDGSTPQTHDAFRGVKNAFKSAIQGIETAKAAGIEFQINTTITKTNLDQIPKILSLAEELGAVAHHIFLLVPTGRESTLLTVKLMPRNMKKHSTGFMIREKKQNYN